MFEKKITRNFNRIENYEKDEAKNQLEEQFGSERGKKWSGETQWVLSYIKLRLSLDNDMEDFQRTNGNTEVVG